MKYNPFKYWWERTKSDKACRIFIAIVVFLLGMMFNIGIVDTETNTVIVEHSRILGGLFYCVFWIILNGIFRGIASLLIVWGCYKNMPNAKIAYSDYVK